MIINRLFPATYCRFFWFFGVIEITLSSSKNYITGYVARLDAIGEKALKQLFSLQLRGKHFCLISTSKLNVDQLTIGFVTAQLRQLVLRLLFSYLRFDIVF